MKTKAIVGLLLSMSLIACSDKPVPAAQIPSAPVATTAQPIIINQAPAAASHDGPGLLTGAAVGAVAGYMVGSSGNNRNSGYDNRNVPQNNTTIINKTVVVKQYVKPKPVEATPPKKVSLTKTSSFGSFKSRRK